MQERTSFDNLLIGPVISISKLEIKQEILEEILSRDLIVTSYITDVTHPVFERFKDVKPDEKPIAVFITVEYQYYYD